MNKEVNKYNNLLIFVMAVAPFVAYMSLVYLDSDFRRIMQLFSYVGVFLMLLSSNRKKSIRFPKYLWFYFLFILYVFYSDLIQLNRDFKIEYLFSNRLIGGFNFMLIIENLKITKKYYRTIIGVSKKILIIAFLVILYQQMIDDKFFVQPNYIDAERIENENSDRLYSIYTWIGHILSCGLSFVPIFIIVVEDLLKKKKKVFVWFVMGIIFVFLTKQRWIMLNFSVVFLLLFIDYNYKLKRFLIFSLSLPILVFSSFFILDYIGIDAKGIVEERILESDKKNLSQKTAATRLLAFEAFNRFFWDNPLTGIGNIKYGMGGTNEQDYKLKRFLRGRSSQIHVGYLSLFYMYGILGGFLFISFLYFLFKSLYVNAKRTGYWAPLLAMLGFAIGNLVDVNFQVFEMGLIIALFANRFYSEKNLILQNIDIKTD